VNVESITSDHHEMLRNDELCNGAYEGRTLYYLDINGDYCTGGP
jgi:hypothetical protein